MCANMWAGGGGPKGRWRGILVYSRLSLNIDAEKCTLSSSATFGGETTYLQGVGKAILLLCFSGSKNSSC